MPIPRQDLHLSHGLWGFEDDPNQLPPVHQMKKTQLAKQEWKRLIDIQRHLLLTHSRESSSSASSTPTERDALSDPIPLRKNESRKKSRVQVKTSTGSRLPNKNKTPNTADTVNTSRIQRKASVPLPMGTEDCMVTPISRESSTAPELGLSSKRHVRHGGMGIKGEQSVLLNVDTPAPSTIRLVDSHYSGAGDEKEKKTMLRSAEMMETLNILLQRRFQDVDLGQPDSLSGSSHSTPIPPEYLNNLNEKKLQLLNRLQYNLRNLMHERCVLIIKREAITRLDISTRLQDQIKTLVKEQCSEMQKLMDTANVPVAEVRRLVMADGERDKTLSDRNTVLEDNARLPKMLELLNEVSIASHWLRRYIRQMVESFHTMIPPSVDPLLLATHHQLNQTSEVAFTYVSAAMNAKLRLLSRLDPSDIDQDILQAMFAQCQIFNKILEFSGVHAHSVSPIKVPNVMERLGREQGHLAALRAMSKVCDGVKKRTEAIAGATSGDGKITRRESLDFEWLTADPHDRSEAQSRRDMIGETSDYFSDYSAGTGVNNRPPTGKRKQMETLCSTVDSIVQSAQSLLIRSNFVATAMSVHEAEPSKESGKRQKWFKPTAEHAVYTCIMQTIATVFWEAYWSSFTMKALESVVVPVQNGGPFGGTLFSLLGVDSRIKTLFLSKIDYTKDPYAQDLDEDALNAVSKIYQEIYFLVATSSWRNDMSRACISYAIRRSKPIPVEGGQVGTDTGRHFHRALQPLLGFIVGCPQDARSHNVVHQVMIRQCAADTLNMAIQWLEDRQMFSSSWDPYQYLIMAYSDLSRLRYLLVRSNMLTSASSASVTSLRKENFLSRRLPQSHFANWTFVKSTEKAYAQSVAFFMSLEQVQLRQFENNCKLMCSEYFAANLPPNRYFKRRKIDKIHEINYISPLLQYLLAPTIKAVENHSEFVQEEVLRVCSKCLVDSWKESIQNKTIMFSYASAFQLREDILKTKDVILTSSLSRKAKESSSPYFNNFVAIASFLMQDPRTQEGEEPRGRGNRVAPALLDQPRLDSRESYDSALQATELVDRDKWEKHKVKPVGLCLC
ncbi:uncharacterized protein LOC108865275 [Galendromus occidentalis]|uniref:Uncharacterized protein LOC108865275 n=1 Tax=Galendromus occidentalis TaxID=34638 RepID=A0AAJ7SJD7_9ACAR|nr:uncharacterized protein LOC108865275 [Galendromus occidentalis]